MAAGEPRQSSFASVLASEQATTRLAVDIADILRPGDLVTLSGDLGVGKTMFARALIRQLAGDPALDVPSPSFTLMQIYELPGGSIVHADLYRVAAPDEIAEIGLLDAAEDAITLVEWPERAGAMLPSDRIDVSLALAPRLGPTYRQARVTGVGGPAERVEKVAILRRLLDSAGFGDAERHPIQGDASTRRYERLVSGARHAILMDSPRRPDGPPVKDGLPYSAIAHLAEDVKPFIAMARGLKERGFSAPDIYASDLARGLVVLEDLGNELFVSGDPPAPIAERYGAAVDALFALHQHSLPDTLPVAEGVEHRLPRYDENAFLIEAELFCDWYVPHRGGMLTPAARDSFVRQWRSALQLATGNGSTWVLRDFHSPNLLWLPSRDGIARVGLLDFQDAVMGPPAYDLVSLLQDARVDVPEQLELELLGRYIKAGRATGPGFDVARFIELYATLGAQRATKILGIFARLDRRDGKPQYLRHVPRVWQYLRRSLAHPVLNGLAEWYDIHAPAPPAAG